MEQQAQSTEQPSGDDRYEHAREMHFIRFGTEAPRIDSGVTAEDLQEQIKDYLTLAEGPGSDVDLTQLAAEITFLKNELYDRFKVIFEEQNKGEQ